VSEEDLIFSNEQEVATVAFRFSIQWDLAFRAAADRLNTCNSFVR